MVHAGLGNFHKGKKLSEYTIDELLFTRPNPDIMLFDDEDIFVISGHTPTLSYTGKPEIIIRNKNILIDCGACFKKGRLGCICLDTMEEFYV
jgi:serine/threonine protein phosphatase 1